MKQSKNKVFVILGPTSTGKTSLAIELCKKYDGEIVSADSRQIYKYMDIGTGKNPIDKKIDIPVHGYDLISPDENYSSYQFAIYAINKIKELLSRGKTPFLVGGTGLYIDMITGRVKPSNVKPDFILREKLEKLSLEELQFKLKSLNEKEYKGIDLKNRVRLIRAIERNINNKKGDQIEYLNAEYVHIGLTASRDFLYENADIWAEYAWKNGLVEETKWLLSKYPNSDKLQGLVYKSVVAFLTGDFSEEVALERIKYDLHGYIRRQLTYFKKNPDILWVDITQDKFIQTIYNITDG